MRKEIEIREDVILYLESLGYKKENFKHEVFIDSNRRVDLVVTYGNKNLVAIEIKVIPLVFNTVSDIGFSPVARQLQKSAQQLEADFYLISNGVDHLWLRTNEIGRPAQIEPVYRKDFNTEKLSNEDFSNALLDHVSSYLVNFPITGDLSYDFSNLLYRKILKDLNMDFQDISNTNLIENESSEKKIEQLLQRWQDLDFINNSSHILNYIDDFLLKKKFDWQVPRWLANFMVSLYPDNKPKNELLDIFAKYGTLISSAYMNDWKNVESFYFNKSDEFWIKSQQLLTSKKISEPVFSPDILKDYLLSIVNDKYDSVFVAPPFGYKVSSKYGTNKIDSIELLISKGLERCKKDGYVIALVSDGVLLSSSFKKFRKELYKKYSVKGIINLTPETFKPYTAVSTSIIVIQKSYPVDNKTFFASLDDIPKTNDVSNNSVLNKWKLFSKNGKIENERTGFISDDLSVDNFHFSNYWYRDFKNENLNSGFQAIPLKELVRLIKRGNNYKKDKKEDVPYLAPAAVRNMKLLEGGLSYTSIEKVSNKLIHTEINDIIINIIGTQKGSAAIVTDTFKGLGLNQHLVLLRPNLNLIKPYYLAIALNSDYVQKQFEDGSTGSVIPSLSLKSFESIYIPVPPFIIQDQICKNYNQKIKNITEKEKLLNKEKQQLNKMFSDLGREDNLL